MFTKTHLFSLAAALAALSALLATTSAQAADTVISSFDTDTDSWIATWGTSPDLTFSALDAADLTTSGSLNVSVPYLIDSSNWQQAVITKPFDPAIDMTQFTSINMDVKVDPASTPNGSGNYGYFEVKNPATGSAFAAGVNLTSTEWTHLSFPIPASLASLNGLIIQLGAGDYKAPVAYNIDNITLTPRDTPAEPPTLTLTRAQAGLNIVGATEGQYDRQNIFTPKPTTEAEPIDQTIYSFVGSTDPVSYSFTIDKFPDNATFPNFQTHIFLIPGNPGTSTAPDYNEATVIFMDIRSGANNSGYATFRIKTDQANGNSEYYVAGLTSVSSATVTGTWTLTATPEGIFTMTAPDGTVSAPIDIGADALAFFDSNLRVYLGVMPNSDANKGQGIHVAKAEIKRGSTTLLSDTFEGDALNTDNWAINASAGAIQFISASEANWLLSWTLPDGGFTPQVATTLTNPDWTDLTVTPATVGTTRQAVLPVSALPATSTLFFRMVQPPAVP